VTQAVSDKGEPAQHDEDSQTGAGDCDNESSDKCPNAELEEQKFKHHI
jgi:hypothetical protein